MTLRIPSILETLRDLGPMSGNAIAHHLGWTENSVRTAIGAARRAHPEQCLRIIRYEQRIGQWGHDFAIYAAQPGKDAQRRSLSKAKRRAAAQRRYRQKNAADLRIKAKVYKAAKRGVAVPINPWVGLAPTALRPWMAQVAASCAMQQAA